MAKQDNQPDHERGAHTIHILHLVSILGPGSVCPPRALLMRRIISNGYLLDPRIPLHIEIVKLGIGKDSKIIFKSKAFIVLLHVLWGMNGVQVRNVLGYIGRPTTTIETCHVPGYDIGRIPSTESKDGRWQSQGGQAIGGCVQVFVTKKVDGVWLDGRVTSPSLSLSLSEVDWEGVI